MRIYIDGELPKSCAECPFMVHCDDCESLENYCPLLSEQVGYDYDEPYTPKDHRQENCPLKQIPQENWGKWVISEVRCPECLEYFDTDCYSKEEMNKCPNCGADMRGDSHDGA